ncbi:hypothetical protein DBR47_06200, partial [Paucibacter sp. KBW04]|uniref:hypothetical protein n=1 Tax=Paucibacter sp. KBW04 TaxID=2153361 RepID=UPI000FAB630C
EFGGITPGRYDFDWLADKVLPKTRAEIRDIRAERSKRTSPSSDHQGNQNKGSIYHWWALVYCDRIRIAEFQWFGGFPEGHRDTFLFLMAVALSWFTRSEALRDEVAACARRFTPSLTEA